MPMTASQTINCARANVTLLEEINSDLIEKLYDLDDTISDRVDRIRAEIFAVINATKRVLLVNELENALNALDIHDATHGK